MEQSKLEENVCRICLEHNVVINWDEKMFDISNVTYKDCYYKYTELKEIVPDPFPTNLCQMCVDDLRNADLLFKKAVESFQILKVALKAKDLKIEDQYIDISIDQEELESQIQSFAHRLSNEMSDIDSSNDDKILLEIEEEMQLSNMYENEIKQLKENEIKPGHFIDMQNFETKDNLLEQKCIENEDPKLLKKAIKNAKKLDSSREIYKRGNKKGSEMHDIKLQKPLITHKFGKEKEDYGSIAHHDNCGVKSSIPSTTNKAGKIRKKYVLICAYCSLQVNGTNQLKKHEATHSEDRKRTEICPKCGIKLYTKMALNNHMKIHDENRQKDYKCEFCEKAFFNRGALNVHRRIHLGLMVTCPICSKEFYRQIDLDRHLLKHSVSPLQKTVEKLKYNVQCQYCNEYVPTNKWREHKAAHLDQPQVKCKICNKNFFARSKCVKHLKRLHKKKTDYEEFIHYYVNCKTRMSHLIIKQQEVVKPLTVNE